MPFYLHETQTESWREHHESSLNGEEMLALAEKIKLIKGLMSAGKSAHIFWVHLANQINTAKIPITKGIHELNRVHFNIRVAASTDFNLEKTVEVFVEKSSLAITVVTPAFVGQGIHNGHTGLRNLFDYKVTGLTVMISNQPVTFPSYFEHGYHNIDRRKSFSLGNSSATTTKAEMPKGPSPVKKVFAKK